MARREVSVRAGGVDGAELAHWTLTPEDRTYSLVIPPPNRTAGPPDDTRSVLLTLQSGPMVHIPTDPRAFGIGLVSVRLDIAP